MSRSSKRGSADAAAEFAGRPDDYEGGGSAKRAGSENSGAAAGSGGGFGLREWGRWMWRQLTSMRVALILLLLLAVATIPGSLFPQRSADPNGVLQYEQDNPELFRILDAFPIQAFDVYSSVWFSSIYLLLFISLIGCVLPRTAHHWKALRSAPPRTPARLSRMAGFAEQRISNPNATEAERLEFAERAIAEAHAILRRSRYRAEVQRVRNRAGQTEVSVSAERGYLRETGNLVFHVALLGVLVCVALGGLINFNGQKVLVEGDTMVNQLIDYDSATSGNWFDGSSLDPYRMRFDSLDVDYVSPEEGNRAAIGLVRDFTANVTLWNEDGEERSDTIRVNRPLREMNTPIYLIANGYAPRLTIHNADGDVVLSEAVPFIPQDTSMTSLGVVKVPFGLEYDGEATQLGLQGFFFPTMFEQESGAYASSYPDLTNPVLTLNVYVGDLGLEAGVPQSVYVLDTTEMTQIAGFDVSAVAHAGGDAIGNMTGESNALTELADGLELRIGDTVDLPDGMGTITLEAVPRYVSFDVMYNPTQSGVLVFALLAVAGLLTSLFVPRRRMWVKAIPTQSGITLQYAALARGDDPSLEPAVEQLRERHRERL